MPPLLHPFYPVVPDLAWIERLVPLGVKTIQLRLKDAPPKEVKRQIIAAMAICEPHNCTLIINDYWQTAIELGANFIHLGQEDLAQADLSAIRKAGLKLGISTHSHEELDIALGANPDYVALGPIWETKLKKMKWQPQRLERLTDWAHKSDVPVVAIGGITLERAPAVYKTGAASIAVVTDIVSNEAPEQRAKDWLKLTA
ncbi:MAG: thiamine phosphate synthase [Hyphomicrobiaceae bacterium]|nr:thiamine phosphate synthase [Hyphomicrobiaceae bacterium]